MNTDALNFLSLQLTTRLIDTLPTLSPDWWQTLVTDKLTYQQQNYAREHGYQSLSQLDLAALLRVADQNWHELSHKRNLNPPQNANCR